MASWYKFTYFGKRSSKGKSRRSSKGKSRRSSKGKSYLGLSETNSTTQVQKVRDAISNSSFSQEVKDQLNELVDKVTTGTIGIKDLYNTLITLFPNMNIYDYFVKARGYFF
jgi:hypothetical protein